MTLDFLPPQAYTKETLLKAYNWLQSQSDGVKEMATTPDQLVSLYLKSSRLGSDSFQRLSSSQSVSDGGDRPSLQSFKSELKNLAGMMGDLEKPMPQPQPQMPPPAPSIPTTSYVAAPTQPAYDETTQNLIREVKNELNLSSDSEAVRMLVKIGYQKVRSLYK